MLVNHIYGMLAKSIVPALMAWNIGTRPVYLCRPAADTSSGTGGRFNQLGRSRSARQTLVVSRKESLDDVGEAFRDALRKFMRQECLDFAERRRKEKESKSLPKTRRNRGTLSGGGFGGMNQLSKSLSQFGLDEEDEDDPFPCHIATSTMPRARETVEWKDMPVKALSNFNPLDKGEWNGLSMEDIAEMEPEWHERYSADPFYTRYANLIFLIHLTSQSVLTYHV